MTRPERGRPDPSTRFGQALLLTRQLASGVTDVAHPAETDQCPDALFGLDGAAGRSLP